ncbi:MAG: hypothetical protein EZS28_020554 [Streblomastix strix]|uniref:Uncharacterized protein n=1 Tax=Streblomastix strix TaxID=222440 RepID=A0A5J4VN92_9EUKA|nr:MAG: hypothetical protein EZS28_020554 [Streblomastix strix]
MKNAVAKSGDLDPDYEAETCRLSFESQNAAAAVNTSLSFSDEQSATMWMLTSHHVNRIIAGFSQQRREQEPVLEMFKAIPGKDFIALDIFDNASIEKLKEQTKTAKLLDSAKSKFVQEVPETPQVTAAAVQNTPIQGQSSTQPQAIWIVPLPQPSTFQSSGFP